MVGAVKAKKAKSRIKINKLLEQPGWRSYDDEKRNSHPNREGAGL